MEHSGRVPWRDFKRWNSSSGCEDAMPMIPISSMLGREEIFCVNAKTSSGRQPLRWGRSEIFTCNRTWIFLPREDACLEIFSACFKFSTLWMTSNSSTIFGILRDWSLPMKCYSRFWGRDGNFSSASWRRFSAMRVIPVFCSISVISGTLRFLVTATSLSFSTDFARFEFVFMNFICHRHLLLL